MSAQETYKYPGFPLVKGSLFLLHNIQRPPQSTTPAYQILNQGPSPKVHRMMSLPTGRGRYVFGHSQPASASMPPCDGRVSFSELHEQLYKAAKTMFPTVDRHYDHVSVLITYWVVGDYEVTVMPEVHQLEAVLKHRYGFDVQRYAIPCTSASTQRDLAYRVMEFVDDGNAGSYDLKIVYYAGHVGVNGALSSGNGLPEDFFTIDWSRIRDRIEGLWDSDTLLLLDCHVPTGCTLKTASGPGDGVMELICRQNVSNNTSFTTALISAFNELHIQFLREDVDIITTGLLFNTLLQKCGDRERLSHPTAPAHHVLQQVPIPRTIQLHQLGRPSRLRCDEIQPEVPRGLFSNTPEVMIEVPLKDYQLLFDGSLEGGDLCAHWRGPFSVFQGRIKAKDLKVRNVVHAGRWVQRVFAILAVPAALAVYLDLRGARAAGYSTAYESTTVHENEAETLRTQLGESNRQLEDLRRHHDALIQLLNDIMPTTFMRNHSTGMSDPDIRPRPEQLKEVFNKLGEDIDKIKDKVDLTNKQLANLHRDIQDVFETVKKPFLRHAVDDWSWYDDDEDDQDTATSECAEVCGDAWSDDGWETDDSSSCGTEPGWPDYVEPGNEGKNKEDKPEEKTSSREHVAVNAKPKPVSETWW
jgi:hypothetical protein